MPYRDDQACLETLRDELRRDLTEATRKAEALAGAAKEKDSLTRELASVEARLERARSRRLPLLESVRVASPCSASWDDMVGDERVRFCGSCQKNVYNLSAMARDDAERLIAANESSICVRLYRRADGTVLTTDCPVGVRKQRVKRTMIAGGVAGAMAVSAFARGATVMQGDMARPDDLQRIIAQGGVGPMMGEPAVMGSSAAVQTAEPALMGTAVATAQAAPKPPPARKALPGKMPLR
jgi:hypothetical protein